MEQRKVKRMAGEERWQLIFLLLLIVVGMIAIAWEGGILSHVETMNIVKDLPILKASLK